MRGFKAVLLLLIGSASCKATLYTQHDILQVAATKPQQPQQQQWRHLLASSTKPSSLTVAGPDCIEAFYNTTAEHYPNDDECSFLVNQAFAATALKKCPLGGTAAGSPVHKCLQKSVGTTAAWVSYLTKCPLANVLKGGKGFSCFQDMATPADFEAYASSTAPAAAQPASRSGSGCVAPFDSTVVLSVAVCLLGVWSLL